MGRGRPPGPDVQPDDGFTVKDWGWADTEHLPVVVAGLDDPSAWSCCGSRSTGRSGDAGRAGDGPSAESALVFVVSD